MSTPLQAFLEKHPGRDFDRDGLRLHYLDEGEGEPVVMVHGNPTWSFYYRNLVEALSDHVPHDRRRPHRLRALRQARRLEIYLYTLESRVDDLEALLDHLGLTRGITLVVHDWGGMIGLTYATRHPDRIGRLVILNTGAFPLPASKPFPWPLRVCRDTKLGAWLVRGLNAFASTAARVGCRRKLMSKALRDAYTSPYDSWANRIATLRFVQDIPLVPTDRAYDLVLETAERLHLLDHVPMLIAWGPGRLRLRPPLPRRVDPAIPFGRGPPLRGLRALHPRGRRRGDHPRVRAFLEAHPVLQEVG